MIYYTDIQVINKAKEIIGKTLREVLTKNEIEEIESNLQIYKNKRKGYLGQLIEQKFFKIFPGNTDAPDFTNLEIELKVTPLKKSKYGLSSKERLVFSMINYVELIREEWLTSKFFKKNKKILIIFYLYEENKSILDYKFKYYYLLNLLDIGDRNFSNQIKKDWESIKLKVKLGMAHKISEGDTEILGACTKSSDSSKRTPQPNNNIKAKPRAFSLKNSFLTKIVRLETNKTEKSNFEN